MNEDLHAPSDNFSGTLPDVFCVISCHQPTVNLATMIQCTLVASGVAGIAYGRHRFSQQCSRASIAIVFAASAVVLELANFAPEFMLVPLGQTAQGTVTSIDCTPGKKHAVLFDFYADRTHVQARNAGSQTKCDALSVGATNTVTYLPGDAAVHVWGSLRDYLGECISTMLFTFVMIGILAFRNLGKRMDTACAGRI